MLTITLPETEHHPAVNVQLEHSLLALSKWEAIHEKVFFGREEKTSEESISYIRQMVLGEIPPDFESRLLPAHIQAVHEHMHSKQTATWFREAPQTGGKAANEVISTELVYYWLVQFQIPFHPTETWHFNRLMTLVKIAGVKQTKPKKMTKAEQAQQMRELNAKRRQDLGTTG